MWGGSKKPKNLFVSFFWKERKKEREREKERRKKKKRETENNGHEIFFLFFLFQSLSLSLSHSFSRTNSRRRTSRNTSSTHPKLCQSTYDARESARAKYHRSWWSRAVPTCHPNDAKPETLWQHWGFNFQIFWFRVRKKEAPGNAIKRAQRFKNCLGEVVSSYKRKEKWTTKRVKRTRPLGARALAMGILILVLITAR